MRISLSDSEVDIINYCIDRYYKDLDSEIIQGKFHQLESRYNPLTSKTLKLILGVLLSKLKADNT